MTKTEGQSNSDREDISGIWNHMYIVWSADEMSKDEFEYRYRQVMQLITDHTERVRREAKQELRDKFGIDADKKYDVTFSESVIVIKLAELHQNTNKEEE